MKLEKYLAMGEPKYSFDVEVKNGVIGTIDLFRQLDEKIDKPLTEKLPHRRVEHIETNQCDGVYQGFFAGGCWSCGQKGSSGELR